MVNHPNRGRTIREARAEIARLNDLLDGAEKQIDRHVARWLTEDEILAGAKFYARASAHRAVNGVLPSWDDEADEANWQRTRPDVRKDCLGMSLGIVVACEFKRRQEVAFERAKEILDRSDRGEG